MNIELPKKFTRYDKNGVREVYIEKGILKMKNTVGFKSLMRKMTYELKGMRCFYCGKFVPPSRITIDHLIPQDIGGPTIINNLVPACNRCNVEKSNMNLIQYMKYLKRKNKIAQANYFKEVQSKNEKLKKIKDFSFLNGWVVEMEVEKIKVGNYKKYSNSSEKSKKKKSKYQRTSAFYKKYGRFRKAIIVDRNNYLLGGFTSLMYAKNNHIKTVPVIILENVEIFF